MGASRTLSLVTGLVFSGGFVYTLRRNVERDMRSHQDRLKDVDFQLNTATLSESQQAAIKDDRPLYREVQPRPYILDLVFSTKDNFQNVIVPQAKAEWNDKIISLANSLTNIESYKFW